MSSLKVEDGSVVTGANTYADIDDHDAYHEDMGNTAWGAALAAAKKSAIFRAMAWIESQNWRGIKADYDQPLEWPRASVVDRNGYTIGDDEIPQNVIRALCEASLIELATPGALRPDLARGGMVTEQTIHGAVTVKYASGAPAATVYKTASGYLHGLTKGTSVIEILQA